jgi:hypothetical protein
MLRDGSGFDVTPYDFQVADAIWGPDIASLKGKTTKAKAMVPDSTLGLRVIHQQQTLVVDIMFIDQVSTLVAVAYPLDLPSDKCGCLGSEISQHIKLVRYHPC